MATQEGVIHATTQVAYGIHMIHCVRVPRNHMNGLVTFPTNLLDGHPINCPACRAISEDTVITDYDGEEMAKGFLLAEDTQ